jgi:Protein of unknown function (DUF1570)
MERRAGLSTLLIMALGALTLAQPPTSTESWKFDVIHLKSGRRVQGLLLKETSRELIFQPVIQEPGKPTRPAPFQTSYELSNIDHIDRLDPQDRKRLSDRLAALAVKEQDAMKILRLERVAEGSPGQLRWRYPSRHFVLFSDAREEFVRQAAFRLEQIYAAYARLLPPRRSAAPPTEVRLIASEPEYREQLRKQGRDFINPAFFDSTHNRIFWDCDLERLSDDRVRKRKEHEQLRERLTRQEAEWNKLYHGRIPADLLKKLAMDRQKLDQADAELQRRFDAGRQRFYRILYHEAFHAYLANYVYPPNEFDVPRWLNEGLAQIFETALLEAGELRVGHADPDRLARVKEALRREELVPLEELLRSGPGQFLVGHATDQRAADRSYLTSWALALYLTFHHHRLGTAELDDYVRALKRGVDPLEAFRVFVKEPLPQFEEEFHRYLQCLRSDGTTDSLSNHREGERGR